MQEQNKVADRQMQSKKKKGSWVSKKRPTENETASMETDRQDRVREKKKGTFIFHFLNVSMGALRKGREEKEKRGGRI